MWNLDNNDIYFKLIDITIPHAFTWGSDDREKREKIRKKVVHQFPNLEKIPEVAWWAFRIYVKKSGSYRFYIENIPKLIIDTFSKWQLKQDYSQHMNLALYKDDTIDEFRMIQVAGERSKKGDSTRKIYLENIQVQTHKLK